MNDEIYAASQYKELRQLWIGIAWILVPSRSSQIWYRVEDCVAIGWLAMKRRNQYAIQVKTFGNFGSIIQ